MCPSSESDLFLPPVGLLFSLCSARGRGKEEKKKRRKEVCMSIKNNGSGTSVKEGG